MRYPLVLACFALVLSVTACTFDDGDKAEDDSAKAVAGQDLVLDIGVAKVVISGASIGSGTGQIPEGSEVTLKIVDDQVAGRETYSPVVEVRIRDEDGDPVTGLNLNPVAVFELSYDFATATADGQLQTDLSLLQIDGATTQELSYTVLSPVADTEYTLAWPGRTRALLTSFSKFAVTDGGDGSGTPTTPTALTGTVSTVLTSTIFTLANTGATVNVTVAVPTSLTTTPPTVITLNDASFNAAVPLDPNNRAITVQTGGNTYTSDAPAGNVVMQLNTFTGTGSSGTMIGTVVRQGGSETLGINFTFTTGSSGATAIGGTVTELAGRRTLNLQDAGSTVQLLALIPDTLPNVALDPITFNDASFDATMPTSPTGRLVTVTSGGTTYSSDVPVVGSVTITFTSFNPTTLVGAGTITGTVVSATPTTLALNYTFTTEAGGAGGSGTFTAGTAVDVTTVDVADEAVITFDAFSGGTYIACWMSDVGTTNRTLEMTDLNTTTLIGTTVRSYEPTAALLPAGGLGIATDNFQNLAIVGATGSDPGTSSVAAIFYDFTAGALNTAEVALGTGSAPRVSYHPDGDSFVIAWQSGANVMAQVFDFDGDPVAAAFTALSGVTLKGLAAAQDTSDEALLTADDASGIVGIYIEMSTGTLGGTVFNLSTSLSGGLCVWDQVGDNYLVLFQELVGGFFTSQVLLTLAPGTTTPIGAALTLVAAAAPTQAVGGNVGAIFADPAANMYPTESSSTGAELVADPIYGQLDGHDIDVTPDGGALAAAGSGNYALIAARGAAGVTVIPLTLAP
jgi:hypothetical protein